LRRRESLQQARSASPRLDLSPDSGARSEPRPRLTCLPPTTPGA